MGIDRDYNSLRQDIWLATDQAYKEAVDSYSNKQAALRTLANAPTIDDFAQEPPMVMVEPRLEPDWTSRDWEVGGESRIGGSKKLSRAIYLARDLSPDLRDELSGVAKGTRSAPARTLAAIEASLGTQAADGMPLHNFYLAIYVESSGELPPAEEVGSSWTLRARSWPLRLAPPVQDYDGPMLFEARAAGSLLAQASAPSLKGARPPLAMNTRFEQMMQALGGRSEWMGRMGSACSAKVELVDDPTAQQFPGSRADRVYEVDEEGVQAQKVALVQNGVLQGDADVAPAGSGFLSPMATGVPRFLRCRGR